MPVQRCYQVCIRRCSNGVCLQWETQCRLEQLQCGCNQDCFDECEQNFDTTTRTSFFREQCGFPIAERIEVRVSDGTCTGALEVSQDLTGRGTAAANVPLPLAPGMYDVCVSGSLLQTVTVANCGVPACNLTLPGGRLALARGHDATFFAGLANMMGGGSYTLSLHRFEDNAHTVELSVPPFLQLPLPITVGADSTTPFQIVATNPQPADGMNHWANVILRATGPATCELGFDVDVVSCQTDAECDDGNFCTTNGTCNAAGQCVGGPPPNCDDGNVCTDDSCVPATGCVHTPVPGRACDDGNACTSSDTCNTAGQCVGGPPPNCDDGNVCTDDSCIPATGCAHTPVPSRACDDGNACTTNDMCNTTGACVGGPPLVCDDGNVCTRDLCDALRGCVFEPIPGCGNQPPDCSRVTTDPSELWPANHKFRDVMVKGVTDPDGDPLAITIKSIFQDEPINGLGDGDTCPDASGVGTSTAHLRAERAGMGDGRVYHIRFTADDGQVHTCSGEVTVCVPHDQGRGHACVDEGPLVDSTGPCR